MTQDEWREGVFRRLGSLEDDSRDIKIRLSSLETKSAVDEVHRQNVETRLSSIEDTLKWLVRLITGAIIVAVITFVMKGGM